MREFSISGHDFIPLCDLLKAANLTASGGEAKHLIAEGKVQVDGAVETRKRCKIRAGQLVEFQGQKVRVTA